MLLQQDPEVLLGSLQEAAEGLTIVTDIERQEEAVTEPKKHAPCCPGHSLVAAEACREGDKARARSSAHTCPGVSGCTLPPSHQGPQTCPHNQTCQRLCDRWDRSGLRSCSEGIKSRGDGLGVGSGRRNTYSELQCWGRISNHCHIHEIGSRIPTLQKRKLRLREIK